MSPIADLIFLSVIYVHRAAAAHNFNKSVRSSKWLGLIQYFFFKFRWDMGRNNTLPAWGSPFKHNDVWLWSLDISRLSPRRRWLTLCWLVLGDGPWFIVPEGGVVWLHSLRTFLHGCSPTPVLSHKAGLRLWKDLRKKLKFPHFSKEKVSLTPQSSQVQLAMQLYSFSLLYSFYRSYSG